MTDSAPPPARPRVDAVIQCAMSMEAAPILDMLAVESIQRTQPRTVAWGVDGRAVQRGVLGSLDSARVLVITSGIGLANAASATARALGLVDAPIVIAAGTTGGLARTINVGDIAAGTTAIYGAADATAFGYEMGQVPQMPVDYRSSDRVRAALEQLGDHVDSPVMTGRIVSSDSFITAPLAEAMRDRFPDAIAADMETCAMAQVAWSSHVDWVSLRAVSDLCGPQADQDFHMDGEAAAGRSARAVRSFLALIR